VASSKRIQTPQRLLFQWLKGHGAEPRKNREPTDAVFSIGVSSHPEALTNIRSSAPDPRKTKERQEG